MFGLHLSAAVGAPQLVNDSGLCLMKGGHLKCSAVMASHSWLVVAMKEMPLPTFPAILHYMERELFRVGGVGGIAPKVEGVDVIQVENVMPSVKVEPGAPKTYEKLNVDGQEQYKCPLCDAPLYLNRHTPLGCINNHLGSLYWNLDHITRHYLKQHNK